MKPQTIFCLLTLLLAALPEGLLSRLRGSEGLPHVAIPGQLAGGSARVQRLRELVRRRVGLRLEGGG